MTLMVWMPYNQFPKLMAIDHLADDSISEKQCSAIIMWSIFSKFITREPHSSPVRARYGVSLVGSNSDSCPASVTIMMYAISCYIIPRYNGIWLYVYIIACNFHTVIHILSITCKAVIRRFLITDWRKIKINSDWVLLSHMVVTELQ